MSQDNNKNNQYIMAEAANNYAALYFSVIPVNYDKSPNLKEWKTYQEHIADPFQITGMFQKNETGIAIVTGKVSLNTEILDEDLKYDLTGTMHDEFVALLNEHAPGLYEKLIIQRTRNKGHHYIYRCETIEGNLKLASRPTSEAEQKSHPNEKVKVLYETRGEGGYFVCAPTPGYEIIQGSFENIPTITKEEREILFSVARSFDQCIKEFTYTKAATDFKFSGNSPFDDYDSKVDVIALLQQYGWTPVFTKGSKTFLKRPGDTKASQSANYDSDKKWFTVFSTSTEFEPQKAYKPYAVFAVLECNADFKEAARKLLDIGFGEKQSYQSNTNSSKSENKHNSKEKQYQDVSDIPAPPFPDEIFQNLPEFLSEACALFKDKIERDVFLIGALGVLSGCFPNYYGIYDSDRMSCNLFVFVHGAASVGKGSLKWSRYLADDIHAYLKKIAAEEKLKYDSDLDEYNADKKRNKGTTSLPKPVEPARKLFLIPANSSAASIIATLNSNKGRGVIFSSEADTLSIALGNDWGNFTDVLRAAFHGEYVSMLRRTNNEFAEINNPQFAVVLSGTPKQIFALINDPENGLFSRFCYFEVVMIPYMKNVFESKISYDSYFKELGASIFETYLKLDSLENTPVYFMFTKSQEEDFLKEYELAHSAFYKNLGDQSIASVRRMAVIHYRIAMILSMLHFVGKEKEIPATIVCTDQDYENAKRIAKVLLEHARKLYKTFPVEYTNPFGLKGNCLKFYQACPIETPFTLDDAMKIADSLNIKRDTAQGYLYTQLLPKKAFIHNHNNYIRPA